MNGGRTVGYDNETLDEKYRSLYGPCVGVHKRNNLYTLLKQEHGIEPTKEWLEDWLVSSCDLIDRYEPASLFFDWWVSYKAFRPYLKNSLPITTTALWSGARKCAFTISPTLQCITVPYSTGSVDSFLE